MFKKRQDGKKVLRHKKHSHESFAIDHSVILITENKCI